jgi:hypothetical protein
MIANPEVKLLVEKWNYLMNSEEALLKAKKVKNVEAMAQLLENQERFIEAQTTVADVAQYTPILVPAVRRIFPNLLANEIVGVQPLSGPTGYAYALRFNYQGAGGKNSLTNSPTYPSSGVNPYSTYGVDGANRMQKNTQSFAGAALVVTGTLATAIGTGNFHIRTDGTSGTDVVWGDVVYAETLYGITKILINLTGSQTGGFDSIGLNTTLRALTSTSTISAGGGYATNVSGFQIVGFHNNEAGFNLIFGSQYAAYRDTADAEYQNINDMKTMGMSIERFPVEAQSRKLKAQYSIELAQDLKNVHGLDAEAELINIIEYEISAELDRELADAIYSIATSAGIWAYGSAGIVYDAATSGNALTGVIQQSVAADGRNELEKFRTLYTRIIREANAVALQTRRGAANFIIASLNVVSALETLSNFMYAAVPGNIEPQLGVAKVGTLDGRFTVYLDTFAYTDFFVVGYKGASAFDTGVVYCPYVPLQIQKVTDPTTFQPLIGFLTRDAIVGNLFGAEKYYRTVSCNFTGSSFIQATYYNSDLYQGN